MAAAVAFMRSIGKRVVCLLGHRCAGGCSCCDACAQQRSHPACGGCAAQLWRQAATPAACSSCPAARVLLAALACDGLSLPPTPHAARAASTLSCLPAGIATCQKSSTWLAGSGPGAFAAAARMPPPCCAVATVPLLPAAALCAVAATSAVAAAASCGSPALMLLIHTCRA